MIESAKRGNGRTLQPDSVKEVALTLIRMQEQIRQLLVIGEAYIDKYGPDVFYEVTGTEPTEEVVEGEVVIDDDPKGQGDEGAEVHAQDTESEEPRLDVPEAAEGTQVQDGQEIADLYR